MNIRRVHSVALDVFFDIVSRRARVESNLDSFGFALNLICVYADSREPNSASRGSS